MVGVGCFLQVGLLLFWVGGYGNVSLNFGFWVFDWWFLVMVGFCSGDSFVTSLGAVVFAGCVVFTC